MTVRTSFSGWAASFKLSFRMRRCMLSGGKPISELIEALRREDLNFFFIRIRS